VIRLRPHHLLCILSYVGRGYTPAFVANMDALTARIFAGEEIEIAAGPDDICAPLLCRSDAHCRQTSVDERDRRAAEALGVAAGGRLVLDGARLAAMRTAFAAGTIRAACLGCEWDDLCTEVARGFPLAEAKTVA
jgi:uncharacterized protein